MSECGIGDESGDARADLRARARRLGSLASPSAPVVEGTDRLTAIEALRGIGPVVDRVFAEGR